MTYRFDPEPGAAGRWKRADLGLRSVVDGDSWAIVDARGERLGWPLAPSQSTSEPPEGAWLSSNDGKSYVYDLVFVGED